MLKHLKLNNLGPAPALELTLRPRLNLVTGDNGAYHDFAVRRTPPRRNLGQTLELGFIKTRKKRHIAQYNEAQAEIGSRHKSVSVHGVTHRL